jgi:hypothetical protein
VKWSIITLIKSNDLRIALNADFVIGIILAMLSSVAWGDS